MNRRGPAGANRRRILARRRQAIAARALTEDVFRDFAREHPQLWARPLPQNPRNERRLARLVEAIRQRNPINIAPEWIRRVIFSPWTARSVGTLAAYSILAAATGSDPANVAGHLLPLLGDSAVATGQAFGATFGLALAPAFGLRYASEASNRMGNWLGRQFADRVDRPVRAYLQNYEYQNMSSPYSQLTDSAQAQAQLAIQMPTDQVAQYIEDNPFALEAYQLRPPEPIVHEMEDNPPRQALVNDTRPSFESVRAQRGHDVAQALWRRGLVQPPRK